MKSFLSVFCFFNYLFVYTSLFSQTETVELNKTTSSLGFLAGYSESIVRAGLGIDYYNIINKDNFTDLYRGYVFGLSYNKQLQDNNNFATITGEVLFQKLPTYYEDWIDYGPEIDTVLRQPPTLIKNSNSNYTLTINGMYNFNLFNTGLAFTLGGSLGYNFNNQFVTTAIVDSNIIDYFNKSYITPIEPFVFGEEGRFTFNSNPKIKQLRLGFIFGLNYNLKIQNTEIEPFLRYNISATNHSKAQYYEDYLHSFQTGLSVRFPF